MIYIHKSKLPTNLPKNAALKMTNADGAIQEKNDCAVFKLTNPVELAAVETKNLTVECLVNTFIKKTHFLYGGQVYEVAKKLENEETKSATKNAVTDPGENKETKGVAFNERRGYLEPDQSQSFPYRKGGRIWNQPQTDYRYSNRRNNWNQRELYDDYENPPQFFQRQRLITDNLPRNGRKPRAFSNWPHRDDERQGSVESGFDGDDEWQVGALKNLF